MRTSLAAAAVFLLGAPSLSAWAGMTGQDEAVMSCALLAGQTALPTGLCHHLAKAILTSDDRIDLSSLTVANPVVPLLARLPVADGSPMAPGTALKTDAAWQAHLDRGVANYRQIFNGQGHAYALPAVPSVLWPSGNPFGPNAAE